MGEFDLSLIREFRTRPGFYDRNSPLFKDKVYNAREWQQIANKLGYDVSLLKDRMLQLRNRYNLEKRRLEQFHDENPGKHLESPWPLYEELTFLSEHIRARRSYKRLLPVNATLSSHNKSSSSSSYYNLNDQQQLYNSQQYFNDDALGDTSNFISNGASGDNNYDAASHGAARFAANGLLAVKMEELDDDDDNEMQTQDLSEDNFEHNFNGTNINGGVEDNDADMTADNLQKHQMSYDKIFRQQQQQQQQHIQKQQQQQQQQHKRRTETYSTSINNNNIINNSNSRQQKHSHQQHQIQQKSGKKFYLPSISNILSAPANYKNQFSQQHKQYNQYRQRLKQQQQQQNASRVGAYDLSRSSYLKQLSPSSLSLFAGGFNQRMQKYVAFGSFMSSSLSELPQQKALMLVEKFTSEVVKVMLLKHTSTGGGMGNINNSKTNSNNLNNGNGNGKNNDVNINQNVSTNSEDINRKILADMINANGSGSGGGIMENIALSSSSSSSVIDANGIEDREH